MQKTILITGSTDGIGLATAKMLASQGQRILLHGRSPAKLKEVEETLRSLPGVYSVESFCADLSKLHEVEALAEVVAEKHDSLGVLINNAGIFKTAEPITSTGLDVRFAVNTIAPYLLTKLLLPLMDASARVVNLSSAAQSSVDLKALVGKTRLSDMEAYAQSKLALTMWSRSLAFSLKGDGPVIVAVNPGSMLGSKMVQEGFGVAGGDIQKGAEIISRAALADEFEAASGLYFDNDAGQFGPPHADALDDLKSEEVVRAIEVLLDEMRL